MNIIQIQRKRGRRKEGKKKGRKEEEMAASTDLKQEEPLFTDGRIINLYDYGRNLHGDYSKTLKPELRYDTAIPFLGI